MDGKIDLITLIALVVAIVAIWKLRSVLGQRTSNDETRIDQQMRARQERERQAAANPKVVTLPRRPADDAAGAPLSSADQAAIAEAEAKVKTFSADPVVEQGLLAILRSDSSFDPAGFMEGAKSAYEMIVTAFAEGNRKMLRDLLSKEVMDGFNAAITERERKGETIDQSFVGINKADLVGAEVKNGVATVAVRFESQLISATRSRTGEVLSGDPQRITDVTDIWSFARELGSRNPNWKLVATESGG